jgi:hypothetical protein
MRRDARVGFFNCFGQPLPRGMGRKNRFDRKSHAVELRGKIRKGAPPRSYANLTTMRPFFFLGAGVICPA